MTSHPDTEAFMRAAIDALRVPPHWLDAALAKYPELAAMHEDKVGICHNIAVAILRDLNDRGAADGWTWCRGNVDGGVDHSWVEFRGLIGVDMDDHGDLRYWDVDARPFSVDDKVSRRTGAETETWAAAQDTIQADKGAQKLQPPVVAAQAGPSAARSRAQPVKAPRTAQRKAERSRRAKEKAKVRRKQK